MQLEMDEQTVFSESFSELISRDPNSSRFLIQEDALKGFMGNTSWNIGMNLHEIFTRAPIT